MGDSFSYNLNVTGPIDVVSVAYSPGSRAGFAGAAAFGFAVAGLAAVVGFAAGVVWAASAAAASNKTLADCKTFEILIYCQLIMKVPRHAIPPPSPSLRHRCLWARRPRDRARHNRPSR